MPTSHLRTSGRKRKITQHAGKCNSAANDGRKPTRRSLNSRCLSSSTRVTGSSKPYPVCTAVETDSNAQKGDACWHTTKYTVVPRPNTGCFLWKLHLGERSELLCQPLEYCAIKHLSSRLRSISTFQQQEEVHRVLGTNSRAPQPEVAGETHSFQLRSMLLFAQPCSICTCLGRKGMFFHDEQEGLGFL